jgi:hypothetical protein
MMNKREYQLSRRIAREERWSEQLRLQYNDLVKVYAKLRDLVAEHSDAASVRAALLPLLDAKELALLDVLRTPGYRPRGFGQRRVDRLLRLGLIGGGQFGLELTRLGWKVLGHDAPPPLLDVARTVATPPVLTFRHRVMIEE